MNCCRIFRQVDVCRHILRIDALCYFREHRTCLTTTTRHIISMANCHDTGIFRVFRRIETTETDQVLVVSSLIATTRCHLCSTSLSAHMEVGVTRPLSKPILVVHHPIKDSSDIIKRRLLANMRTNNFHGELFHHLAIFRDALGKARAHHLAVVGNGIVERNGADGRNLCFVADRHPCQSGSRPVVRHSIPTLTVFMRHTNIGVGSTIER